MRKLQLTCSGANALLLSSKMEVAGVCGCALRGALTDSVPSCKNSMGVRSWSSCLYCPWLHNAELRKSCWRLRVELGFEMCLAGKACLGYLVNCP